MLFRCGTGKYLSLNPITFKVDVSNKLYFLDTIGIYYSYSVTYNTVIHQHGSYRDVFKIYKKETIMLIKNNYIKCINEIFCLKLNNEFIDLSQLNFIISNKYINGDIKKLLTCESLSGQFIYENFNHN